MEYIIFRGGQENSDLYYLSLLMLRVEKIKGRVKKEWKIPLRWAGRGGEGLMENLIYFFLSSLGCFYWYFNAVRSKDLCF